MEKMVYERPVMRVQEFRANAYCAGCNRTQGSVSAVLKLVYNNALYYFDTNAVTQLNPLTGKTQYYYNELDQYKNSTYDDDGNKLGNAGGTFYLTYVNAYNLGEGIGVNQSGFYLYKEDSRSGYSGSSDRPNSNTQVLEGSGVGLQVEGYDGLGANTLGFHTNGWYNPWFGTGEWWYADEEVDEVTQNQFTSDTKIDWIMSY